MSHAPAVHRPTPRRLTDRPTEESLKETFESVIIAFILAFVFRAYVVEAFVIPTGSMGPTLLGEHLHTVCSQCGYRFDSDARKRPANARGQIVNTFLVCPMCHFPNPKPAGERSASGDRILVHKYVYSIVEPARWDVVVFKDPGNPSENFIKRLIGLPNERIWVIEGNVYTQPSDEYAGWSIARKTDSRHGYRTQRDLWQPVYHSQYVPLDEGKLSLARQVGDPGDPGHTLDMTWSAPWSADDGNAAGWQIDRRRSYQHAVAGKGRIAFDFNKAIDPLQATWYPHNQLYQGRQVPQNWPALVPEDLRLSAIFQPQGEGLSVTLSTQARLGELPAGANFSTLSAQLASDGQAWLEQTRPDGQVVALTEPVHVGTFTAGKGRRVELWYVDQEASLWVDGDMIARKRFDLTMETVSQRPALRRPPQPAIEVNGPPVTLHEVEVDRDIHYTATLAGNSIVGLGTLDKTDGQLVGRPVTLASDQFYCLGDNSPMSSDGRFWQSVNPWIQQRMFDPNTQQTGIVPRKLMLGRAFFVYFPAMYPWKPGSTPLIPNFGDLRFIH